MDDFIVFKVGHSEYLKVCKQDISYLKACRSYCKVFSSEGQELLTLSKPLAEIEQTKGLHSFERIHRSYMVNPDYIISYKKGKNPMVKLKHGEIIPLSINKCEYVSTLFGN